MRAYANKLPIVAVFVSLSMFVIYLTSYKNITGINDEIRYDDVKSPKFINGQQKISSQIINRKPKSTSTTKTILIWSTREKFLPRLNAYNQYLTDLGYPCQYTDDVDLYSESSAVVIFGETVSSDVIPNLDSRKPEQYFVYWAKETPTKLYSGGTYKDKYLYSDKDYDAMFNLTWYFRQDADVVHYFGSIGDALDSSNIKGYDDLGVLMRQKTDLVGWAVSNCDNTPGSLRRMSYAKQLIAAGLNLTTYGLCFDNYNKNEKRFFDNFKFYLAFENSIHCPDYITEKFWKNSLRQGVVPIIFGPTKLDVEKVAPKHSYIHVDDFSTPAELVNFINFLDRNDEAYLEFHKWRLDDIGTHEINGPVLKEEFAKLCSVITQSPPIQKTYPSMKDWLFSDKHYIDNECLEN